MFSRTDLASRRPRRDRTFPLCNASALRLAILLCSGHRKGLAKLDGSDPLLLNGYGSYEISNDPVGAVLCFIP